MTPVDVVVVTRNAAAWIDATLSSVARQTVAPARVLIVDDASTDGTVAILARHDVTVLPAATTARDVTTRIAQNFVQGVRACDPDHLVALGDHDDVWHAERVQRQAALLDGTASAAMVASDGLVVDAEGRPTGATLRQAFPVTAEWERMLPADRMRHALRYSIATGGASMIKPSALSALDVPDGWLHDRWWSLVATARGGMVVDREYVIDYRVQAGQQLGLDRAAQAHGGLRRLVALAARGRSSLRKYRDLRTRLRPLAASPDVAAAIRLSSIR